jgi:hypothetical protein
MNDAGRMPVGSRFVHRSVEAVRPRPWKNGAASPASLPFGLTWRMSVADVGADGLFSTFEHQRRHSVVLQGSGLALRGGAGHLSLDRLRCVSYDGGAAWRATLRDGAVRVFNVITTEGKASAEVVVARSLELPRAAGAVPGGLRRPGLGHPNGKGATDEGGPAGARRRGLRRLQHLHRACPPLGKRADTSFVAALIRTQTILRTYDS